MAMNAVELNPNETSKLLQDQGSSVIIWHDQKRSIDEQKYAEFKKAEYAQQSGQYEKIALREWLRVELQKGWAPPIFRPWSDPVRAF